MAYLPIIGNYTFFGVNPSTNFADTFFKSQANKRANDAVAQTQTKAKEPENIDGYAKQIFQRTTNILPVYSTKVQEEYGKWLDQTDKLKKMYGKGYTNTREFNGAYMELAQKLSEYQLSSKEFNENVDVFKKNPYKFGFNEKLLNAVQKNDYNEWVAAIGNGSDKYQNGMGIRPLYDPFKPHAEIIKGLDNNIIIKNTWKNSDGTIDVIKSKQSLVNDPSFKERVNIMWSTNPVVREGISLPEFQQQMADMTQGDLLFQSKMNAPKPPTNVSNSGGSGFSNSVVTVTESTGNTLTFEPAIEFTKERIDQLREDAKPDKVVGNDIKEKTPEERGVLMREYISKGFDRSDLERLINDPKAKPMVRNANNNYSWDVSRMWNIAYNNADPKTQNVVVLDQGLVVDQATGKIEKEKGITGSFQGVIERNNNGKKQYWALIKTPNTTVGGNVIEGETKIVEYNKNIAGQIEGATRDKKDGSSWNLYKSGVIGGGGASTGAATTTSAKAEYVYADGTPADLTGATDQQIKDAISSGIIKKK